jgi:8-oxo-dGTP diphosphatase
MWEFPGGKLEAGELASAALVRELKEEVGIDVESADYLGEVQHSYGERVVSLQVYHVSQYQGEATRQENQMDLKWATIDSLHKLQFPAANSKIIELFRLTTQVEKF